MYQNRDRINKDMDVDNSIREKKNHGNNTKNRMTDTISFKKISLIFYNSSLIISFVDCCIISTILR